MNVLAALVLLAEALVARAIARRLVPFGSTFVRLGAGLAVLAALASASLYLALWLGAPSRLWQELGAAGLMVAVLALARFACRPAGPDPIPRPEPLRHGRPPVPRRFCDAAFLVGVSLAIAGAVLHALHRPHGESDAWAMWNTKAALLAAHTGSLDQLAVLLRHDYHPDYPLLLPALVARLLRVLGVTSLAAPIALSWAFTAGTAAVLGGAVAVLRGPGWGKLAVLLLLATPGFVRVGVGQLADVPLAFFVLMTCAMLLLACRFERMPAGLLVLAGISLGCGVWTKNEGILFAAVLCAAWCVTLLPALGKARSLRALAVILCGALPCALLTALHKLTVPAANDLVGATLAGGTLPNLLDAARYGPVLAAVGWELLRFGNGILVLLAVCWFVTRPGTGTVAASPPERAVHRWLAVTVVGTLAGYLLVYVATPHDQAWHLYTSLRRVLLHLWPAAVLLLVASLARRCAEQAAGAEATATSTAGAGATEGAGSPAGGRP